MLPAARKDDAFGCPTHGGGTVQGPCQPNVLIEGRPAARVGDGGPCGPAAVPDTIQRGNPLVLIGGAAAAGVTHLMAGGGRVTTGSGNVFIGNPVLDANGNLIPTPPECKFVIALMAPMPDNFNRLRAPVQMTPGLPAPWDFRGVPGTTSAVMTVVTIRGYQIPVVSPAPATPVMVTPPPPAAPIAGQLPSVAQVASSLGALSDAQLSKLKSVVLNPVSSPYNGPKAWADALNGRVTIYPTRSSPAPAGIDHVFQHETGHLIWEGLPAEVCQAWQDAMNADRRAVSDYGNTNIKEDFAEAVLMFALVKGTPCEAAMKAAFPGRFALLQKIFGERGLHAR